MKVHFAIGCLGFLFGAAFSHADILVFKSGRVFLPVILSDEAAPEERRAAAELVRVLGKISGLPWPSGKAVRGGTPGFYIGSSVHLIDPVAFCLASDWLAPKANEVGPDGFRIHTQKGSVLIESATPEAAVIAVSWFLQHMAGVRWYAPGPLGEVVPRASEWTLSEIDRTVQPAFLSRELTGLDSPEEKEWSEYNGLARRFDFGHSIGRVFTGKILKSHPHWRPILRGVPYQPLSDQDHDWQPNITETTAADFAATQADQAIAQDRSALVFSLGLNDSTRFDQSERTAKNVEPLHYFRGMPDYSPLVFGFMNRAALALADKQPHRYLSCLAYLWWQNVPPFPVQTSVIPFLATDRSQYYNPNFRSEDLDLIRRWGASGVRAFGLWDYAYGEPFLIPRQPLHALAEGLREGWRNGARGYFAELEPHPGFDVFKSWMLAQLAWDPMQDVDSLKNDFFLGYYGAAAGSMRAFFEACEQQWMGQSGDPTWLKYYGQTDQALLFPPEICDRLRQLLSAADHAAAGVPDLQERILATSRAFAVTESFVQMDRTRRELQNITHSHPFDQRELSAKIAKLALARKDLEAQLQTAVSGASPAMRPMNLQNYLRDDPVPQLLWLAGRIDATMPAQILAEAGKLAEPEMAWKEMADVAKDERGSNLLLNDSLSEEHSFAVEPSFLYPRQEKLPAEWKLRARPTENARVSIILCEPEKQPTLHVVGADDTQFYQWRPATAHSLYLATAMLRGQASPGNDSALFLAFLSSSGERLGEYKMQSLPKGVTDWNEYALSGVAPENAAWVGMGIGVARQSPIDWIDAKTFALRQCLPSR